MRTPFRILSLAGGLAAAIVMTPAAGWAAAKPLVLMYAVNRPGSLADFAAHARQVDIIAPQVFEMAADGQVTGQVPALVARLAAQDDIKLMPLVTNAGFSIRVMDAALRSPAAERRMIRDLTRDGRAGHWWGIQFDFEHIPAADRARYSRLCAEAERAFHRAGLKFSVTIVPRISSNPRAFSAGGWDTWSGVYDYRALGRDTDFVTVMTYSEHSGLTAPGPVSGMPWIEACLRYARRFMPARKISIGAAFYSTEWVGRPAIQVLPVPAIPARYRPLHPSPWRARGGDSAWLTALWRQYPGRWDPVQQVYVTVDRGPAATRVIWWSRARSLRALWRLAQRDHLAGVSAWRLGQEDPAVWSVLPGAAGGQLASVRRP
ncbi:MAG: glycosyl hydrolase family 18 protein [Terriglobales bacterium]